MFSAIMDLVFGIVCTVITILLCISSASSGKTDIVILLPFFAALGVWSTISGIKKFIKRVKEPKTTQE